MCTPLKMSQWRRISTSLSKGSKVATVKSDKVVDKSEKHSIGVTILPPGPIKKPMKTDEDVSTLPAEAKILSRSDIPYRIDAYEDIPGPRIFRKFSQVMRDVTRNVAVCSLLWLFKTDSARLFRIYGPVVKLPEFFGGRILVINRSEHVSCVFRRDPRYPVTSVFDSVERCRSQRQREGDYVPEREWEEVKRTLRVSQIEEGEKRFAEFERYGNAFVRIVRVSRNKRNETPENFSSEIDKWSLECFGQILFNKSFGFLDCEKIVWPSKQAKLLHFLSETTKKVCSCESGLRTWRFLPTSDYESLEKCCEVLEKITSENVRQAQLNLMKKRDLHGVGTAVGNLSLVEEMLLRESMTPHDVTAWVFDLLLLGTNALSSAFAFFLYYAAKNPRTQEKLFQEIKGALPEKSHHFRRGDLESLKYLGACLKETLRLKMPLPVATKILSEDVALANYRIPRGTCIVAAAQIEALKEENFEDATAFRPERWTDEESKNSLDRFPFDSPSVGRRAEEALKACIVHFIRKYCVEYNYGELKATLSAISLPDKPLVFTITDRDG